MEENKRKLAKILLGEEDPTSFVVHMRKFMLDCVSSIMPEGVSADAIFERKKSGNGKPLIDIFFEMVAEDEKNEYVAKCNYGLYNEIFWQLSCMCWLDGENYTMGDDLIIIGGLIGKFDAFDLYTRAYSAYTLCNVHHMYGNSILDRQSICVYYAGPYDVMPEPHEEKATYKVIVDLGNKVHRYFSISTMYSCELLYTPDKIIYNGLSAPYFDVPSHCNINHLKIIGRILSDLWDTSNPVLNTAIINAKLSAYLCTTIDLDCITESFAEICIQAIREVCSRLGNFLDTVDNFDRVRIIQEMMPDVNVNGSQECVMPSMLLENYNSVVKYMDQHTSIDRKIYMLVKLEDVDLLKWFLHHTTNSVLFGLVCQSLGNMDMFRTLLTYIRREREMMFRRIRSHITSICNPKIHAGILAESSLDYDGLIKVLKEAFWEMNTVEPKHIELAAAEPQFFRLM